MSNGQNHFIVPYRLSISHVTFSLHFIFCGYGYMILERRKRHEKERMESKDDISFERQSLVQVQQKKKRKKKKKVTRVTPKKREPFDL
jgi:hypothetical protein